MLECLCAQNPANFSIDSTNSIVGRTVALLQHLEKEDKSWAQYLTADKKLDWSKVAVAGHSRASGIVAALSKVPSIANVVTRMAMVGGPGEPLCGLSCVQSPYICSEPVSANDPFGVEKTGSAKRVFRTGQAICRGTSPISRIAARLEAEATGGQTGCTSRPTTQTSTPWTLRTQG